jgi:ketosteroid isomerase-like protein
MPDPQAFARSWLDAWNRHDISAVLAHFADDATFASPLAMRIVEGSDGRIRGKRALRDYWAEALRRNTRLHFELIDVHVGIDALVINYRSQEGASVNEVLIFGSDGLVAEGYACRNDR